MKQEEININDTKIETGSLFLRPFEEGDLDDLYEYCSIEGVGEAAGWKHVQSKEEAAEVLNAFIARHDTFAIVQKSDGKVIGSASFKASPELYDSFEIGQNKNDIGYVIAKPCWGKGYAIEAVRAMLGYAFCVLHLQAVTCAHFAGNNAGREVIEKCGFKFVCEGKYKSASGEDKDACFYAITHKQYGVDYSD